MIVDLWREILRFAEKHWEAGSEDREIYDALSYEFLGDLRKVSAEDWSNICGGLGHSVYGAVALSWCQGATLAQVWSGWLASGFPLKPLPEYERPARFLNPALLPQTETLNQITGWVNEQRYPDAATYDLALSALIAGSQTPVELDMVPEAMRQARPQIAAFLKSHMLQKPARTPEEDALIAAWSERVKGTEFDTPEAA